MIEFISGVFFGWFLNWYALIGLFLLGTFSVHNESKFFGLLFLGLFAFTAYKFFNISLENMLYYVIGYIVVGFMWSFWRYKKYVRKHVNDFNNKIGDYSGRFYGNDDDKYKALLKNTELSKNVDLVVFWVLVFPLSMIENLLGDLIDFVTSTVTVYLKSVYESIINSELKNVKYEPKNSTGTHIQD